MGQRERTDIDLSAYITTTAALVRFRTVGSVDWKIDDIHVGSTTDGLLITNGGPGRSTGFLTAPFTVTNQTHHFIIAPISSPQQLNQPFTLAISAVDQFGYLAANYIGAANLQLAARYFTFLPLILKFKQSNANNP
jgi:hypothetical protein